MTCVNNAWQTPPCYVEDTINVIWEGSQPLDTHLHSVTEWLYDVSKVSPGCAPSVQQIKEDRWLITHFVLPSARRLQHPSGGLLTVVNQPPHPEPTDRGRWKSPNPVVLTTLIALLCTGIYLVIRGHIRSSPIHDSQRAFAWMLGTVLAIGSTTVFSLSFDQRNGIGLSVLFLAVVTTFVPTVWLVALNGS